jgi:uncharacterized tellurite resistance protein B-like protein
MSNELHELFGNEISLKVDKFGAPADRDMRIATTTLLVYVAQADGVLHPDELRTLMSSLARNFGMADEDNAHMIQVGEFLCRDKSKFEQFIQLVQSKFEKEQLIKIIAMMWRVMEADGVALEAEEKLIHEAVSLLKLSEEELEQAKKMVATHKT